MLLEGCAVWLQIAGAIKVVAIYTESGTAVINEGILLPLSSAIDEMGLSGGAGGQEEKGLNPITLGFSREQNRAFCRGKRYENFIQFLSEDKQVLQGKKIIVHCNSHVFSIHERI